MIALSNRSGAGDRDLQRLDKLFRTRNPSKLLLNQKQRCIVIGPGQIAAENFPGAVSQEHRAVFTIDRITDRGLNANARPATRKDDVTRSETFQVGV